MKYQPCYRSYAVRLSYIVALGFNIKLEGNPWGLENRGVVDKPPQKAR